MEKEIEQGRGKASPSLACSELSESFEKARQTATYWKERWALERVEYTTLREAVEALRKAKGRHNTMLAYNELMQIAGQFDPDKSPLDDLTKAISAAGLYDSPNA